MPKYVLEDDFHAQWLRTYDDADAAIADLRRLTKLTASQVAADIGPTPCADHCGHRELHVIEETGNEIARADTESQPRA